MKKQKVKSKILREKEGITLIALVITIIVLLILAGVSIATLTGDNGILNQAQRAKDMTNKSKVEEEIQVEVLGSYNNSGELDLDNLNNNLKDNLSGVKYNSREISDENKIKILPAVVEYNGYKLIIAENEVTVIEESVKQGEEVKKTEKYNYNDEANAATIPAGFNVSEVEDEQKIENGLVIKDGNGNEFVWIPCTTSQYKNAKNAVMKNKWSHNKEYETNGGGNGLAWRDDYTEEDIKNITEKYKKGNTVEDNSQLEEIMSNLEDNQTSVAKESIRKYGGFYIARYEAGIPDSESFDGTETHKVETNKEGLEKIKNLSPVSKKTVTPWNWITQPNAKIVAENMYKASSEETSVGSYLVDSQAWNHICENIFEKLTSSNITDSSEWGNYEKNGTDGTLEKTGFEPTYKKYNIYDMAGNVWEWTTGHNTNSNSGTMFVVGRGRWLRS